MIDWLLAIFYFLNIEITITQIVAINLPIVAISRLLYMVSFYVRYKPLFTGREKGFEVLFPNNFFIYFLLKELVLISAGIIYFPVSLGIAIYSLMVTGDFLRKSGETMNFCSATGDNLLYFTSRLSINCKYRPKRVALCPYWH